MHTSFSNEKMLLKITKKHMAFGISSYLLFGRDKTRTPAEDVPCRVW